MKKLIFVLPFLTFFAFVGCTQTNVTVHINERNAIQLVPIEYKITGGDTASAIRINANNDLVQYSFIDQNDIVISSSSASMDTDRPFEDIKDDLFTLLSLTDLQSIFGNFTTSADNTGYPAFGNLLNVGWPNFAWSGSEGTSHLANRDICTAPYNSFTRTFGTRVTVDVPNSAIGASSCIIDNQIYYFSSAYTSDSFYFFSLNLYKLSLAGALLSTDTLLWRVGTHGGVNETTYTEFDFYGIPLNITGETWIVPWYEFNNERTIFLLHYLYTEDNFDTWEVRDIPSDIYSLDENYVLNIGQDTLISVSRNESNTPMMGNRSIDGGDNWGTWKLSNLGSFQGKVMGALINTPEYGIVVVYSDRGTGNIMVSKNNSIENIVAYPYMWNTPDTLYNTTVQPTLEFSPLGYPTIVRVAQYRYMIAFSIEISGSTARLYIGDGRLDNIGAIP